MIRPHRWIRHDRHPDSTGDGAFVWTLGFTRVCVPYEWDDPTEFSAAVDPDVHKYDTAGRFDVADYRYWWEQS